MAGHDPAYTITADQFRAHLQMLHDKGFHCISPDEYLRHETAGTPLPDKPVMITFDDNHEEQYLMALPLLNRYHFTGTFFIMTVTIGKAGYMSALELRRLADSGHTVALHTWDHPDVRHISPAAWTQQLDRPRQQLEKITGGPVRHFAYPYGAWDTAAITRLKKKNIATAYQLWGPQSNTDPLYTIRRILVRGNWTPAQLYEQIQKVYPNL